MITKPQFAPGLFVQKNPPSQTDWCDIYCPYTISVNGFLWSVAMDNAERESLYASFREASIKEREARVAELPKAYLSEKHMQNCDLVLNRMKLLGKLPKWATVAELGVDRGGFSEHILNITQPGKFHLVDLWNSDRYHEGLFEGVQAKFSNEISQGKVQIHRKDSISAAADFPDAYFDWIYIDTTHMYSTTWHELRRYAPKMKPGGIIAGHDYNQGNWVGGLRYGVIEAVHEFCVEQNWELIYLTAEFLESQSFAIRKIP